MVIAGQGTVGLEILEQAPEVDDILVAIGGGGLISGIALTIKALRPSVCMIGIEPTGSPALYESVKAGHVVELTEITTCVPTMACAKTEPINLEIVRALWMKSSSSPTRTCGRPRAGCGSRWASPPT